jgi:hypothetical protein
MTQITVKDASSSNVAVARVVDTGSTTDSASLPVAQSTEHKAAVGSVTETAPATDTASSGLNGRLQRIAQRLTSLIALLPSSLGIKTAANSLSIAPASDAQFSLLPAGYRAQVTVTRPANTTPYTAGDVVGGAITFPSMGPSAGHVLLTSCDLRVDIAAIPSGMTSFRLYLYSATPPSALADNAAWDLPSGDRASYIGYIDLGAPLDLGSTLFTQVDQINKQCKLGTSETALYGYLVTTGGFTPAANSEVYTPTLRALGV